MQQTSATTGLTPLFNEEVRLTGFTEYGYSLQDLLQGKPLPPEGARFDIGFEGEVTGDRIAGSITGTDFLEVRADGRFFLHLQASLITRDGAKIKVTETGINDHGTLKLFMSFYTLDPAYRWLNNSQVLGLGHVDMVTGAARVNAYLI